MKMDRYLDIVNVCSLEIKKKLLFILPKLTDEIIKRIADESSKDNLSEDKLKYVKSVLRYEIENLRSIENDVNRFKLDLYDLQECMNACLIIEDE